MSFAPARATMAAKERRKRILRQETPTAHLRDPSLTSRPTPAPDPLDPNKIPRNLQSLSSLLKKADDLNGVKWGGRVGVKGGHGKTFLQAGAASSILDWLSGEAQPELYGELDLGLGGGAGGSGQGLGGDGRGQEEDDDDDDEEEFHVGRGRRWRTVGSSGGRYG